MPPLKMIVGLGNPGKEYERTRHNVGMNWLNSLANSYDARFKENPKLKAWLASASIEDVDCLLLKPTTYMNQSGISLRLVCDYFQISLEETLVVHDEMAFSPGVVKLKSGGGANGHNGLRSLFSELGNNREFHRLRIGVGHPGDSRMVTPYLTKNKIPIDEQQAMDESTNFSSNLIKEIVNGCWDRAMNKLHGHILTNQEQP